MGWYWKTRCSFSRFSLDWNADNPAARAQTLATSQWQPARENLALYNYGKAEDKYDSIPSRGPYDLELVFHADFVDFFNPPYRYRQWLGLQHADSTPATTERNEWRRHFRQVTHAFGGDRVIYLADNSHQLTKYWDLATDESFARMEQQLRYDLGEPKATFAEVLADEAHGYFTDFFTDLD